MYGLPVRCTVRKSKFDCKYGHPPDPIPDAPKHTLESRKQEKTEVMGTLTDGDTMLRGKQVRRTAIPDPGDNTNKAQNRETVWVGFHSRWSNVNFIAGGEERPRRNGTRANSERAETLSHR